MWALMIILVTTPDVHSPGKAYFFSLIAVGGYVYINECMAKKKDSSLKLIVGLVVAAILAVAVGVVLYQANTNKSATELRARAADPCEAYPKLTAVNTTWGVVHDKTDSGFNWWEKRESTKVKVVVLCAGAKFTREFGGDIPYSDINEGDSVALTGNYGDTTKTTILARLVKSYSTSKAAEYSANVATVNHAESSFTLSAVKMIVAEKSGSYTLNVKYTPTTKCYFRTKQKPLACSAIAVGNSVGVTGVVYDPTLTLTATNIVVNY